jgi:hypothetical protein
MADTKLTKQEKDKLIAWRKSISCETFLSSNCQILYSHHRASENGNAYQNERRLYSKVCRYVIYLPMHNLTRPTVPQSLRRFS